MSDQLVEETPTLQHATLTTHIHTPSGIRTHNFGRREAAELRVVELRNVTQRVEQAKKREDCSRRRRDAMGYTSLGNSAIKMIKMTNQ
jgi:hypothetical protein